MYKNGVAEGRIRRRLKKKEDDKRERDRIGERKSREYEFADCKLASFPTEFQYKYLTTTTFTVCQIRDKHVSH